MLRIDNRKQSAIRATFHCCLGIITTISYPISNESLYFCLYNHVKDDMNNLIFSKIIDFKPIFPLIFFEHGYLAWYLSPKYEILHS